VIGGSELLGLASATAAAACFDGAVVFQAMEARRIPVAGDGGISMARKLLKNPRWLLASGLAALGWPFQLLAFSLAPLTLVQPTLSLGLVLLLVMGHRMLRERIGLREVLATAAIVTGVVGITLSAPKNSDAYNGDWRLIVVLALLAAVAAFPFVPPGKRLRSDGLLVASAGAAISASALTTKLVTDELAVKAWSASLAWALVTAAAAAVGLLGEMSALQRRAAARVAPPIFVISTVVPVAFAPFLTGETWTRTPLGGGAIILSLAAVAAGGALLGQSKAVGTVVGASHGEGSARSSS
jgi:drug/metabolite transporter (DMT)-like permease